jgi:hypothetical protein
MPFETMLRAYEDEYWRWGGVRRRSRYPDSKWEVIRHEAPDGKPVVMAARSSFDEADDLHLEMRHRASMLAALRSLVEAAGKAGLYKRREYERLKAIFEPAVKAYNEQVENGSILSDHTKG